MKKWIVMGIGLATLSVSMFGCAPKSSIPDTENNLIIEVIEAGYGYEFLNRMAENFEAEHEGVSVYVKPVNKLGELVQQRVNSGPDNNAVDLYFATDTAYPWRADIDRGGSIVDGYDTVLADLSEVYTYKADGKNSLETLIPTETLDIVRYKNKAGETANYVVPWAREATGLVYNEKMFLEKGWNVPKTTNQLKALVSNQIKDVSPFIWSGETPYWQYLYMVWWAQYEGLENFQKFYSPKQKDPLTGMTKYVPDYFSQEGRKQALKLTGELVSPEYSYTNSTTLSFSIAQGFFMDNRAAMMPNGGWLENEIRINKPSGAQDFRMMKTPIISDIIHRLPTINSESTLIDVIDYVDAIAEGKPADKPVGVSDDDIEEIRTARNMVNNPGAEHVAFIPAYSNAKNLAIEFLKYFFSDEGCKIFLEESRALPSRNFDYTDLGLEFTPFELSRFNRLENMITVNSNKSDPLFHKGISDFYGYTILEKILGATNADDRLSGEEMFDNIVANVERDWSTLTSGI